jgi:hypothetical protein
MDLCAAKLRPEIFFFFSLPTYPSSVVRLVASFSMIRAEDDICWVD